MDYVYEPLKQQDSIRLLELIPGPSDSPLACNLVEAKPSEYDYGVMYPAHRSDRSKVLKELSTSTILHISEALYDVLARLRKLAKNESVMVWVDVLCINVCDHQDRWSHTEVRDSVYFAADFVVALFETSNAIQAYMYVHDPWKTGSTEPRIKSRSHGVSRVADQISQSAWASITKELYTDTVNWLRSKAYGRQYLEMRILRQTFLRRHNGPYIYDELAHPDSIRVLQMYEHGVDDVLRCKIIQVNKTTAKYSALSYVWGPQDMSRELHEESSGMAIPIPENLFHALSSLNRMRKGGIFKIWVDAVCIDQSNLSERNHQVKTMASIYSSAQDVLVWLGRDSCRPALRAFATMRLDEITRRLLLDCTMTDLHGLFAREWFTRVWILQEFLLAKKVRFFAGQDDFITYEKFANAISRLKQYGYFTARSQSMQHGPTEAETFNATMDTYERDFALVDEMFQARESLHAKTMTTACEYKQDYDMDDSHYENWETKPVVTRKALPSRSRLRPTKAAHPRTLYQWCCMMADRKCTDERDRVYAALGLVQDHLDVLPDYNLSYAEVRLDLARKSLFAGDFTVLHDASTYATGSLPNSEPSFVPVLSQESRRNRPSPLRDLEKPYYSAGLARPHSVQSKSHGTVTLQGVSVDETCYLDAFSDVLDSLTMYKGYVYMPQLHNAYERAKTAHAKISHTAHSKCYVASSKISFWRTINVDFRPARADVAFFGNNISLEYLEHSYRQNIARCFQHRVFFMTSSGYMGLGPEWMKRHDRVVIFDGADTPFLLRRADKETWKLVGDCYLDGWMDGKYNGHEVESVLGSTGVDRDQRQDTPYQEAGEGMRTLKSKSFTLV